MEGLLAGLLSGAADTVSRQREDTAKREQMVLDQRRGVLDTLMQGMINGTVRPEHFARVWSDYEQLAQASAGPRKSKGGKAGFMGQTDLPHLQLFDAIANGELPFMSQGQGQPQAAGQAPQAGAPGHTAELPPPPADSGADLSNGGGEAIASMTAPHNPGTTGMSKAAAPLATDVQTHGPARPTMPGLFYSPEEIAARNAAAKGAEQSADIRAQFSALEPLVGREFATKGVLAKMGYNEPTAMKFGKAFQGPDGSIVEAAVDPSTNQYVTTQHVQLANGQILPAGSILPPTFQPFVAPTYITDDSGHVQAVNKTNNRVTPVKGARGRSTPQFGSNAVPVPDGQGGYTYGMPNRFSGRINPTGTQAPDRTEGTEINPAAADAQEQMQIVNKEVGDDVTAIADMQGAKDQKARQLFGKSWNQLLQEAGASKTRSRGSSGGRGAGPGRGAQPMTAPPSQQGGPDLYAEYLKRRSGGGQ